MPDVSDMELLQDYHRQGSDTAFALLVQRHINLVYSVALRHVGIAAHAEEITQVVFIILARKAAGLRAGTILEGWLHETTRLTALSFLRGERRRQFREQEAYMQSTLQESTNDLLWNQLSPLLDEAVSRLGKKDRDAVMLRFFKEKNLREVAAALKVNEAAAQRRALRAVEKLRGFFIKRGVVLSAAVLTAAISANSVQAAPVALAKSVTAVAIAKGATASASTLTLIKGALKIMAWAKAKTAIFAGVGTLAVTLPILMVVESNRSATAITPGFGPVIERVINSDDPKKYGANYIDFDTGQQPPRPSNVGGKGGSELDWMQKAGIDASSQILAWKDPANRTTVAPGMIGFDMTVVPISNDQWEKITPASVQQQLTMAKPVSSTSFPDGTKTTLSTIGGNGDLPLTYLFKTREGGEGILQITGYTNPLGNSGVHPRGASFRYKLVQPR